MKTVVDWAAGVAEKTATTVFDETAQTAVATGTAARTGLVSAASVEQAAVQGLGIIKSILASAAQTFAGIFAFLSPVMGPAAVGPAAAAQATVAAMAGAASFDVGAWELSKDQVAVVHKGEMVVPAGPAAQIRASVGAATNGSIGQIGNVISAARAGLAATGLAVGSARQTAAGAQMPAFEIGSWSLPRDMVSLAHQGETTIPAGSAPWAQSLMAAAASGGGSLRRRHAQSHSQLEHRCQRQPVGRRGDSGDQEKRGRHRWRAREFPEVEPGQKG